MSTEVYIVCDKCGEPVHKKTDEDIVNWRHVTSTPGRIRTNAWSFLRAMQGEPEPEPEEGPKEMSWHLCPPCGDLLAVFFQREVPK